MTRRGLHKPGFGKTPRYRRVFDALGALVLVIFALAAGIHQVIDHNLTPEPHFHPYFEGRQYGEFGGLLTEDGGGFQHPSGLNNGHLHPRMLDAIQGLQVEEFISRVANEIFPRGRRALDRLVQRVVEDPASHRFAYRVYRAFSRGQDEVEESLGKFFLRLAELTGRQVRVLTADDDVWSLSGGYMNAANDPLTGRLAGLAGLADMVLANWQNDRRSTIEIKRRADMSGAAIPGAGLIQMIQAGIGHHAQVSLLLAGNRIACLYFRDEGNDNVQIFGTPGGIDTVEVTFHQFVAFLILAFFSGT